MLLGIIFVTFLIALVVALVSFLICVAIYNNTNIHNDRFMPIVTISIGILSWIIFIFVGIGINQNDGMVWISKYNAQKITIEASLSNEYLTGLERVELVKQASELNGELAMKKASAKLWYSGLYDNTIYDNVDFIDLGGGNNGRSD